MEREKFEESLKNAFDKAEISPSDNVWTNIELGLEKERGGHLKRRLMFYQMLAAASVVFAMAVGGVGYYKSISREQSNPASLAIQTPQASDTGTGQADAHTAQDISDQKIREAGDQGKPADDSRQTSIASAEDKETTWIQNKETSKEAPGSGNGFQTATARNQRETSVARSKQGLESVFASTKHDAGDKPLLAIDDRKLSPFYTPRQIELKLPVQQETVDPVLAMLARLDQRELEVQGGKKNKSKQDRENENENLWTSIGFAAGSFSSVQSSVSGSSSRMQYAMALTAPIVEEETKASGYSYSMGISVGTKLAEKWVFQGGVNYLTHASQYTANNVVASNTNYQQQRFRAASTNDLLNFDSQELNSKIVYTAPYNVNNSMRYLSIPMQAGYLVVNKTFGLQLNAGVATDLFLQNTVTDDSDQLDKASQPGGSESPYRSVNLSGLLGTEVSYRFGEHYRISLNPGIRYPFNSIYKSELGLESTPLTFDVGLRFRYIFH